MPDKNLKIKRFLSFQNLLPLLLCFAAGAVSAYSMAPFNAWYLLFAGLGALYYFTALSPTGFSAFWRGWSFAFGYFVFGLSWIGNALLVEGNPFSWAQPIAVAGLPCLLSVFPGLACLIAWRFSNMRKISGYVFFAAAFFAMEWLRGHIFTGFPWNLFGYTWADSLPMIQSIAVLDIYALTFLTILGTAIFGFWLVTDITLTKRFYVCTFLILLFAGNYLFGAWRLNNYRPAYHENTRIRIVQPNIPQAEKWDNEKMTDHFFRHVRLSYPANGNEDTTYIIWPETALSSGYAGDPGIQNVLQQMLNSYPGNAYLLTGLLEYDRTEKKSYNKLVMIDKNVAVTNEYTKHHPVPFGEYIPFEKWIPGRPFVRFAGFTAGDGLKSFVSPQGLVYSPVICYEIIFPGAVVNKKSLRPDFIVNVTNDAWYGDSAGPRQHFLHAKFRAVEEGIPVIRAASTGISGMIGPLGRIYYKTDLFTPASKDLPLPLKVSSLKLPLYLKNAIYVLFFLMCFGWGYLAKSGNSLTLKNWKKYTSG